MTYDKNKSISLNLLWFRFHFLFLPFNTLWPKSIHKKDNKPHKQTCTIISILCILHIFQKGKIKFQKWFYAHCYQCHVLFPLHFSLFTHLFCCFTIYYTLYAVTRTLNLKRKREKGNRYKCWKVYSMIIWNTNTFVHHNNAGKEEMLFITDLLFWIIL